MYVLLFLMNFLIMIGLLINTLIRIEDIVNLIQIQGIVKLIRMNAHQHAALKTQ